MSGTITAFASLSFVNSTGATAVQAIPSTKFTTAGNHFETSIFNVPTTAGGTAIPLGGVATAGGWFFFQNNDLTNNVDILTGVNGSAFLTLKPGEFAIGRFNSAVTAPAALAHTAAIDLEYLILDL